MGTGAGILTNIKACHSESLVDDKWDQFLQSVPSGEYQQSSMWARVKRVEGWEPIRWVFRNNDAVAGGFQILWKKTKIGRIGYISRGPVIPAEGCLSKNLVLKLVVQSLKIKKIKALIVQTPSSEETEVPFEQFGFIPNNLVKVLTSTIRVDVSDGINGFQGRMNTNTRRIIRQAVKKGVVVREGNQEDIGLFFRLMEASCRRQGARPNPPTERSFEEVWSSFAPKGCCRLTIAEFEGRPVSGLLCLPFGKVVHLWKKGSLAGYLHLHPMDLLYSEVFCWASQKNYKMCDFEEMVDRSAAEKIFKGEPIPVEEIHPRDRIHLRFGGKPYLLQDSHLFVKNHLIRYLLNFRFKNITTRLIKGVVKENN